MAHLVPHARRHDTGHNTDHSGRPSSSYHPVPPRTSSPAPYIPQRPTSDYVAPPLHPSAYSTSTPRPYSQPPTGQFGSLSLDGDAPRDWHNHGKNGHAGPSRWEQPQRHTGSYGQALAGVSGNGSQPPLRIPSPSHYPQPIPPTPVSNHLPQYTAYPTAMTHPPRAPPTPAAPSAGPGPPLVAFIPTVESLRASLPNLDNKSEYDRLLFSQDVLRVLDRHLYPNGSPTDFLSPETTPSAARLPQDLEALLNIAIPIIISFTTHPSLQISALASYLRGKLLASGACPDFLARDQRQAFKDFEVAARSGDSRGWFRLGRDYEGVGDLGRARECFERGRAKGDCESTYRMGMAHLLGQLHLSPDPSAALPLLRAASEQTTPDFPQPSYVYGMLLAGELSTPTLIPPHLLLPPSGPPTDALQAQQSASRDSIERAAHFGLAPAQYKLGYLFEHASLGTTYDPLMSVQWYSLASQGGEIEADMALSKWFLCGAEGHFGKNEDLARTFAEKAARRGHPNGCFAMGYYFELGIGGRQDRDQAKKWYQRAAKLNNPDAIQRLAALSAPTPQQMTLSEHQSRLNDTLVRRHTQAKIRSDRLTTRRMPIRDSSRAQAKVDAARLEAADHMPSSPGNARSPIPSSMSFPRSPIGNGYPQPHLHPDQSRQRRTSRPQVEVTIPSSPSMPHRGIRPSASSPNPQIVTTPPSFGPSSRRANQDSPVKSPAAKPAPQRGYILEDALVPTLPEPQTLPGDPGPRKKGPQTFAEMGFVSKPVQDEGCIIM